MAGARLAVDLIDAVKAPAAEIVRESARRLPGLAHADCRLEVAERKTATAENGAPKTSGDDATLALGVRVLAGDRMVAPGYVGLTLGAADAGDLPRVLRDALEQAYRRARANAERKAEARGKHGALG